MPTRVRTARSGVVAAVAVPMLVVPVAVLVQVQVHRRGRQGAGRARGVRHVQSAGAAT